MSNGAGKLSDGTETLNDGMKMLDENSKALLAAPDMIVDGLTQLKQGLNVVPSETDIQKLMQGSTTVKTTINGMSQVATGIDTTVLTLQTTINGLKQAAYSSQELNQFAQLLATDPGTALSLPNAQGMIQAMAGAYVTTSTALDGASTTITGMKNYTSQLSTGLSQLNQNYQYIDAGVQALAVLPTAAKALEQGMNGMIGVIQKEKDGIVTYVQGVKTAYQGIMALNSGAKELKNGSETLDNGAKKLTLGIHELYNGSSQLSQVGGSLKEGSLTLMQSLGQLHQTSTPLLMGMNTLYVGIQKLDEIKAGLLKGALAIKDGNSGVNDAMNGLYEGIKTLKKGTNQLYSTVGGKE